MTDQPANSSSAPPVPHTDDYVPPTASVHSSMMPSSVTSPISVNHQPSITTSPPSSPSPMATPGTNHSQASRNIVSQSLEDQNVFHLLGVTDGTDDEKEAFLDELQQVIWEDFLENDLELLVTEEELADFRRITAQKDLPEDERQEKMVVYLEKLIPDLEEIMLEKALELKEDMVRERVGGMREHYANRPEVLKTLDHAEELMNTDQWREAAQLLNSIN